VWYWGLSVGPEIRERCLFGYFRVKQKFEYLSGRRLALQRSTEVFKKTALVLGAEEYFEKDLCPVDAVNGL
jgi:hypothetical protein